MYNLPYALPEKRGKMARGLVFMGSYEGRICEFDRFYGNPGLKVQLD
jgi:hypothetical protein